MSICTAMVQVDACGWVVCGKTVERGNRCAEHQETHAVEKMTTTELFDVALSRIRRDVADAWWKEHRIKTAKQVIDDLENMLSLCPSCYSPGPDTPCTCDPFVMNVKALVKQLREMHL